MSESGSEENENLITPRCLGYQERKSKCKLRVMGLIPILAMLLWVGLMFWCRQVYVTYGSHPERKAAQHWYQITYLNVSMYGIWLFRNYDPNDPKLGLPWCHVMTRDEQIEENKQNGTALRVQPDGSSFPLFCNYKAFILANVITAAGQTAMSYGTYMIRKRDANARCNVVMLIIGIIGGLCMAVMSPMPANGIWIGNQMGIPCWTVIGALHFGIAGLGLALILVYQVIHLLVSWSSLGTYSRAYFLTLIVVQPPALTYWVYDKVLPPWGNSAFGSTCEWITIICMFLYTIPLSCQSLAEASRVGKDTKLSELEMIL